MTSTIQTPTELCQTVVYDKIINASSNTLAYMYTKDYDQALATYKQILSQIDSLNNLQQRESVIVNIFQEQRIAFSPLTQLPPEKQNQWIEWLQKVQQYALNFSPNVSFAILEQLAKVYQLLKRRDLVAIAISQATLAASQIPDAMYRATFFIQLANLWLQFPRKAAVEQAINEVLVAVDQFEMDDIFTRWSYLSQIATLYLQVGLPQQALALIDKIEDFEGLIRQEVVRDAIKRGRIHFALRVATQLQKAELKAQSLVEIAVYFASHHRRKRGDRLFHQALQLVAQDERAEGLQSSLIQIYATSGQPTIALHAAQKLTQEEPKALALGAIIVAYAQAKQHRQVQKLLGQLMGLIQSEAAVNPVGYLGNILHLAVNAKQYDLAIAILNGVKNNTDFYTKQNWYREIVQTQLLAKRLNKALHLAKQIPSDIWEGERSARLQEIAIAYANAKQWRRAVEVLTQIQNTLVSPSQVLTRTELAVIAPTETEFNTLIQPAIAQVQSLESKEHKALALVAIAQAYLRSGDEQTPQSFVQQAIQTVKQEGYVDEQGTLMGSLSDYLIQQGQYTLALAIAKANPVAYWQQSSYGNIFSRAVQSWAFDVALQIIELESFPDTQAAQLIEIATMYAQLQRYEDAIVLLDRAFGVVQQIADPESRMVQVTDDFQVPDERDRAHQYTRLVKLYVNLGRLDQAQKVVEKVEATELRDYLQAWIDCEPSFGYREEYQFVIRNS